MLPTGLRNPFLVHQIDATDCLPPGDVPELHAPVLGRCHANFTETRQSGRGLGLLIAGEAGSGKSHLIAQLRRSLLPDPHAVLAAIPLYGAFAGQLWRHVREKLVSELLREIPSETKKTNGLLRLLHNRFPKWAGPAQSAGLLDWLLGRSKAIGSLQPHLEAFAKDTPLDQSFMRVLNKVGDSELGLLAQQWLRGAQLADDDLDRLGLPQVSPNDIEQEQAARKVVRSLLDLAGSETTVVLCFDQVESLQAGVADTVSLQQFANLANELSSRTGQLVVMTFIRPRIFVEMQRQKDGIANIQRIAQSRACIPPLTWEQAVRLVRNRLEAEPSCHLARLDHADDPDWPLGNAFLEKTFRENRRDLTPRHLIMACRNEFDRLQRRIGTETQPPDPVPPPRPRTDALDSSWERKRQRQLTKLQGIPFDQVMAIGLPWLVEATALPFERSHDSSPGLGDVNLLFRSTGRARKPLAISFCNHEPQSLWRRLDRIKSQWEAAQGHELGSFVVLRFKGERTTPKAEERLTGLAAAGVRVLLVEGQQLAELAAYQQMLTMAHDGDIVIDGRPVEIGVFDEWARAHLTGAVKEFLDTVFEPDGKKPAKHARVMAARI